MDLVFAVSNGYLNALKKESFNFNFNILGYSTFKTARIKHTVRHSSDILGYVFIEEKLPRKLKDVIEFLEYIDSFSKKDKVFIFCLQDNRGLNVLKQNIKLKNIKLLVTPKWEVMTDKIIKDCFAPILMYKYPPYVGSNFSSKVRVSQPPNLLGNSSNHLECNNIIDKGLLLVMTDINRYKTYEETRNYDLVLNKLAGNEYNKVFYIARDCRIKNIFGISFNKEELEKNLSRVCSNRTLVESFIFDINRSRGD